MTYSHFTPARILVLVACVMAFGVGCDNSVDQTIPDAEATPEGWNLVWSDEFDGDAVDSGKWEFRNGDGCGTAAGCGWGNNELQIYAPENTAVEDGLLKITAQQSIVNGDTSYTSSRLRTEGMGDWTYGRFEIRAKLPEGQGLWPAIWLLFSERTYGEWPLSGEIDIMEATGDNPDLIFGTIHYGDLVPNNVFTGEEFQLRSGTFSDDFFVYIVEWEEGEIRWYLNNVLYQTRTSEEWFTAGADREENPNAPFDHPFHMILNVAVGGNLPGAPDATTVFPQQMQVDYVRVYERAE